MQKILFYLFYGFLWMVARLPLPVLYVFSYGIFLFLYYLIPYRKKLVFRNLKKSFPEYDRPEIRRIARRFYLHFCDSFIEASVTGFLSEKNLKKRYRFSNPEIVNRLYEEGKSISLMMGHFGNWEWASLMPTSIRHKILPIYKPLHNPWFDKFFRENRERFGTRTVPMEKIYRVLTEYRKEGTPTMTFFLADQRPRWAQIQYWTDFLNQKTPVVLGPEKISRKFDHAVVFYKVKLVKRGYYELEFIPLLENAAETEPYEVTTQYMEILEKTIQEKPELWLWTHNRWKHDYERFKEKPVNTISR